MDSATPSFKFPHPTPFNGKRDGFSVLGFLKRMTFFFDGAGIAESRKVGVTLAFAGDEVIGWWALLNKPSDTSFPDFSELLAAEFSPAKFKEHILALTMQMKMTLPLNISNVMAYITKAREYHLLLQSYYADNTVLNDTIRTAFLSGAPTQLRQMLEVAIVNAGNDTIDLPRLFKAAEEFGRIFHTGDPSLVAKALAASGSSAGITDPNAMEVDNIHIQLNNIHKQLGTFTAPYRAAPPTKHDSNHDRRTHIHDALVVLSDRNQNQTKKPVASPAPVALSAPLPRSSDTDEPDPLAVPPAPSVPLSKSQLKKLKRRAIRLHEFTVQKAESQLLTFIGSVNGHAARILIDGGAEGNIISSSFQKRHQLLGTECLPIPILLPNGSSSLTSPTVPITLNRSDYSDSLNPILYPLNKYDLILGKPWLTKVNPCINWRTNDLHFTHNGIDVKWSCRGFKADHIQSRTKGLLLTHMHFHSMATLPGSEVFLALIRNTPEPSEETDQPRTIPDMTPEVRSIVMEEFADVFPEKLPDGLPPDRGDAMKIETDPTADPPFRPVIRLSIAELDELRKQLDQLLAAGFIKPSTSPYGAPVLFVRKKDGTLRMCVDYRGLNKITRKNRHPLPRIDELLDRFRGARYYSKLDLLSGYHQQRIFEPHTHKTAFRCRYGHFEFNVVPFGLTNAPASFSNMMLRVLDPVLDKWVVVYLDDLLIYSKTKKEHLQHLRSVLALLRKNGLYAKLSKCSFMQDETEFLGHTITKDGIKTSAGLSKAIIRIGLCRDCPPSLFPPRQQHSLQMDRRTTICIPSAQTRHLLRPRPPHLRPRSLTFVETDASGFAIGAVLLQTDREGNTHPIAFTSRKMQSAERNYPVHEQELLAVIHALRTWRYYLDGTKFSVHTDHATLRHFPTQPKLTRRQARWMELLQEYDFDFKYKRGVDNIVPDALSRRPDYREPDPVELYNLSVSLSPDVRDQLVQDYNDDPRLGPIYKDCLDGKVANGYSFQNNLLYFTRRGATTLAIPRNSPIRLTLLHDAHDSATAGHFGFQKTYDNLRRFVYWPHIAKDTQQYVATCEKCQRNKDSQDRPAGLLQPLPIPSQRWEYYLCHAVDVAHQFFDNIFKLHGKPTSIISDRDTRFTSRFWQELHRLMDVKLALSTAYHPQTDGQTEVMNKTLKTMLRAFIDNKQSNWDQLLPSLEFAYNNAVNASTGYSPFFLNSGQHPRLPTALLGKPNSSVPTVDTFLTEQATTLALAQDALQRAQDHQEQQADKRRRDHKYKVGDKVLLRATNITIPADSIRPADKLRPQFLGPFTLLEQHSPVTFRVELPPFYKIHDVFHVDTFRPYLPSPESLGIRAPAPVDPTVIDGEEEYEVDEILKYRFYRRQHQFLVSFKAYGREADEWLPVSNLDNCMDLVTTFKEQHGIIF
ncbi:hypothetical protein EMPS_06766 [Entomortierella parvispora]|uniref:RNA-directed DNA polymerase n=2 Tax=Entomortierella parvispora TaxID=205924 RepID=A0A9P3LXS6_9FUNG|nr:hypothetical protein EMPS_06766 [Entomortierella parvispora]